MANDLDAATSRSPLNSVPQTQGPGGEGRSLARDFQPFQEIGATIGGFGDKLGALAEASAKRADAESVPEAERSGTKSVGRDSDGNVFIGQFDTSTAAGRAANAAALQGGLALKQAAVQTDLMTMSQAHRDDPDGYRVAVDSYVRTIGQKDSAELRPAIRLYAQQVGEQHFRSLTEDKNKAIIANASTALSSRLTDQTNTIYALARQGGADTPEFQTAMSGAVDIYKALAQNPAYGYPPERVQSELQNLRAEATAQHVVGNYRREYEATGDAAGVQRKAEAELMSPDLRLDFGRRMKLVGEVTEHLRGADAMRTAETTALVEQSKNIRAAYSTGRPVKDDDTDVVIANLTARKKWTEAYELDSARATARLAPAISTIQRGSIPDAISAAKGVEGVIGTAGGASVTKAVADRIVGIESGGSDTAKNPRSSATGAGQFISETWLSMMQRYRPDLTTGKSRDAVLALRNDGALSREMTQRYAEENAKRLTDSGLQATAGNVYLGHFLGAGGAVKLLSADPSKPVGSILSADVIAANPTILAGKTAGEVSAWAAKKMGGAVTTMTSSPAFRELVTQLDTAATTRGRDILAGMNKQAEKDRNYAPTPIEREGLSYFVERSRDDTFKRDAQRFLGVETLKDQVGGAASPELAAGVQQAEATARAGGLGPNERQALLDLRSIADARQRAATDEPTTYGAVNAQSGIPVPKPIDLQSADGFRSGIGERQAILAAVKQREPTSGDQVFSVAERKQLGATLGQMQPAAAQAVASTLLQTLRPEQLTATMADDAVKQALVGMTRNPEKMGTAFSMLDRLQQVDPMGFDQAFGHDQARRLALWQDRIQYLDPKAAADFMRRLDDPAQAAGRKVLEDKSGKLTEAWTPADVAKKTAGAWFFQNGAGYLPLTDQSAIDAEGMLHDYREAHADFYGMTGDDSGASAFAIKRIQTLYGPSQASGGRLMKNPPEKYFRPVEGSWGWIGSQLDAAVRDVVGPMGQTGSVMRGSAATGFVPETRTVPGTRDEQAALERYQAPRALFADRKTQEDISSKRPPSYAVVIKLPDGRGDILRGADGLTLRFRPDQDAAMRPAAEAFTAADARVRQARQRADETNPLLGGP